MKNYFQRQDIIDIQQIIQIGENWQKHLAPSWEIEPQGINAGCSERQCTGSIREVHCSAMCPSLGCTGDSKPFFKAI